MAEDILNNAEPIDPHDPRYQALLDDLQGNILKGHGRDNTEERRHRIVRRGITYGERQSYLEDRPTHDVGLLFMCFQSDIADQFEFIQRSMANEPDFVKPGTGPDPVIAQGGSQPQKWPVKWGEPDMPRVPFDFHGFVTLKGGEYFFAPSISFLKKL